MKLLVITPGEGLRNPDLLDQLAALGDHDVITVDAIFLDDVPAGFDRDRARAMNNRDLTLSEIGCALAHRSAWERIAADDDEWACVLEDDAIILDPVALRSDLGRIEQKTPAPTGSVVSWYTQHALMASAEMWAAAVAEPPGGVCYCISREAARRLAEANRHLCFTADWPRGSGVEFHLADGDVIGHDQSTSSLIGSQRVADRVDRPIGVGNLGITLIANRIGLYTGVQYLRYRRYFSGPRQYYRLVLRHRIIHHVERVVGRPLDPQRPGVRILRRLPWSTR